MRTGLSTFAVGETVYKYDLLAPVEALRYGTQCAKVLGPALASVMDVVQQFGSDKATVGELVASAAPALAAIDEDKVATLMQTAFKRVYTPANECLGDEAVFNDWFQARPHEMFPVGLLAIYHLSKAFFPKLPAMPPIDSPI